MSAYTIKEISEMFHIPSSTLRYYEDAGILPNIERNSSGQRIFTDWHIERLKAICCFKNTGMTIVQLKQFFGYEESEPENIDEILNILETRKETVEAQIENLQKNYVHILRKLCYYKAIKESLNVNQPLPRWKNYETKDVSDFINSK